ncbi:actin related protein 2/3 complex, subunit 5A, partial [Capsicum annuum]
YTPAIDIWSIGCISVEVLTEKPLFLGKNIVHHLDLITDLLGTPSADIISGVRNEKASPDEETIISGQSVVHQLDLITDLLGKPSADIISGVRNEKARKYLTDMKKKSPVVFTEKFQKADPLAL